MQKIKDFVYYNRKDIVIVAVMILLFLSYIFVTSNEEKKYIEENPIEDEENLEINKEDEKQEKNLIVIDIKGEINNPGTYEFDEEKRIVDVVEKAGGLTDKADTKDINLSEKIYDEMLIVIPSLEDEQKESETKENTSVSNKTSKSVDSKISINKADITELMKLNGIGESKAKNIIDYREKNGNFKSIEEIKNVTGIGNTIFDKIKDFIKV